MILCTLAGAAGLSALYVPAVAQSESEPGSGSAVLPPVLARFLEDVQVFSAEFVQEVWTEDLELLDDVATGTVRIRRPNRFLWEYTAPYEQTIVSDGDVLWMYDVELEQATRSGLNEATSASPAMLLSGNAEIVDAFAVVDESSRDGVDWITMVPEADTSEFETVRLGFEGEQLTQLEFVNGLNQTTVIRFASIDTEAALPDEIFEFTPPRGVHVLGSAD